MIFIQNILFMQIIFYFQKCNIQDCLSWQSTDCIILWKNNNKLWNIISNIIDNLRNIAIKIHQNDIKFDKTCHIDLLVRISFIIRF